MDNRFVVSQWAAFAPGLGTAAQWADWARAPWLPAGDDVPPLAEMPAMQRRRLERLGRMALQVAWQVQPEASDEIPLVFASRHGDISRTFGMLQSLARGEALSPTHFGLSTHNAIVAQYSIARGLGGNYLAVAGGRESPEAAVTEALGLLADGAPEVLVVQSDDLVPADYAGYQNEPQAAYAWAWRLRRAAPGEAAFSLSASGSGPMPASGPPRLPHGLEVLRWFLGDEPALPCPQSGRRWDRHAALA
ncbi:beta-ketoacyl synthase chain length factor [Arenimonas caeni]|uniref:3-oxoacyl-ACP synthase n=1 Tax=Arenimonas caeni TaxID=2058085 RepID=A0A2P6MB79_9GAMM|nr:beta-ketoacyl synthase chain length factor [Arenimonas caeni]PRH83234.1 3-oxoacyl-ACP synthase [Arenimonas caeni]